MITAVITTYRRDKDTVRRAALSVLAQDYRPLELVIVDDNRDDETGREFSKALREMVLALAAPEAGAALDEQRSTAPGADAAEQKSTAPGADTAEQKTTAPGAALDEQNPTASGSASDELSVAAGDVRVFLVPTEDGRHGAQAARNTGIHRAKGEYLAFLDDDDEWLEGKLRAQMKCLKEHPEAGMCYCRGWRVDQAYDPPYVNDFQGEAFREKVTYRMLLRGDCIGTTSQALIPKSTFEKVGGFDLRLPARQDYEMWIRIASAYDIVGVDEHYFRYYKNGGKEQITRNWDKCIEGHTLLYEKYKKDIDADRAAKFNVIFFLAHYYMCKGDKPNMIKYYATSFFTSPVEFWKKGLLKLESIRKDRELRKTQRR